MFRSKSTLRITINEREEWSGQRRNTIEELQRPSLDSTPRAKQGPLLLDDPSGKHSVEKLQRHRLRRIWNMAQSSRLQAVAGGALALALLLLLGLRYLARTAQEDTQTHYAVYIDAGSSGTRVHVFAYTLSTWPSYVQLQLPEKVHSTEPGLSSYAGRPQQGAASLQPLLDYAYEQVPEHLWQVTPVHLLATAGLRLLSAEDAAAILHECTSFLASSKFMFNANWAKVISGDAEGMFAWTAANYVAGALEEASLHHHHSRKEIVQPSMFHGVLELGGASFQVTFMPQHQDPVTNVNASHVNLPGITNGIFTHSFLGLGMDSAMRRAADIVRERHTEAQDAARAAAEQGQNGANAIPMLDPCLPTGYMAPDGRLGNASFAACMEVVQSVLPPRICSGKGGSGSQRHLQAAGSSADSGGHKGGRHHEEWHEAENKGSGVHEPLEHAGSSRGGKVCAVEGVQLPPVTGTHFLAIENFFWTARAVGLGPSATLAELRDAGATHCARSWDSLHTEFAGHVPDQFITRYCFGAAYVYALLHERLGVAAGERVLRFTNTIKRVPVSARSLKRSGGHGGSQDRAYVLEGLTDGSAGRGLQGTDAGASEGGGGAGGDQAAGSERGGGSGSEKGGVEVGLNWVVGAMLVEAMNSARHGTMGFMRGLSDVEGESSGADADGEGGGHGGLTRVALLLLPAPALLLLYLVRRMFGGHRGHHHAGGHHVSEGGVQLPIRPGPGAWGLQQSVDVVAVAGPPMAVSRAGKAVSFEEDDTPTKARSVGGAWPGGRPGGAGADASSAAAAVAAAAAGSVAWEPGQPTIHAR